MPTSRIDEEVVTFCSELIAIDTSNFGANDSRGERAAAEYVAALLSEVGLEPFIFDSAPGRTSLVVRVEGTHPELAPLILHGHLDVVPADASEWSVHPFSGHVDDEYVWGRGAVDMKDMNAMILATVRDMLRSGKRPRRPLVLGFFSDEEAGSVYGAHHAVTKYPELFAGAVAAVSEVGGYSTHIDGKRAYLLQTAEKGMSWLELTARGAPGHGSQVSAESAIISLVQALQNIASHQWPMQLMPSMRELFTRASALIEVPVNLEDRASVHELIQHFGALSPFITAATQNTSNITKLDAGYKENVIPSKAQATVDIRFLPGEDEQLMQTVRALVGDDIEIRQVLHDAPIESPISGGIVDVMTEALRSEDPDAYVLPYCMSGGTDNKAFGRLGIHGYGFVPLQLPSDLDFMGMFHGIDEHVPKQALYFGTSVLKRFLERY